MRITLPRLRRHGRRDDDGIAMVAAITMTALIATLTVVTIGVAATNFRTSGSDRLSASALEVSESGIAQAISYIKSEGVGKIKCAPNCGTANPWGEAGDDGDAAPPKRVTLNAQDSYDVWFETLQAMNAAGKRPGVYRVVSVGTSNPGPGSRRVEVDIEVQPFDFPIGVFADKIDGGGDPGVHHMSMFATGCISSRSKIEFAAVNDLVYGFPAGAHSAEHITDSNGCTSSQDSKSIHKDGACPAAYLYDEDSLASTCYGTFAGPPPFTLAQIPSKAAMATKYDFNVNAFTDAELERLKQVSIEQGLYITNSTAIPASLQSGGTSPYSHPVLFYDLMGAAVGGEVDLKFLDDTRWGRTATTPLQVTDPGCSGKSVIVIVKNGNVKLNSNTMLAASVFALGPGPQYGKVSKANGSAQLFGTLYGTSLDMTGTADIRMDQCVLESMSGAMLSVGVKNFREVDR